MNTEIHIFLLNLNLARYWSAWCFSGGSFWSSSKTGNSAGYWRCSQSHASVFGLYFYSVIEQNGPDSELLVRPQRFWAVYLSTSPPLFLQRYHFIKTNWQGLYRSVTPGENRCASPGPLPRPARNWCILPSPGFSLLSNCSFWIPFFSSSYIQLCTSI